MAATKAQVSFDEREKMIAEAAYYRALQRGFEDGDPVGDWLDAEEEVDARFTLSAHDKKLAELYVQLSEANEKLRGMMAELTAEARAEWNEEVERIHRLRDRFSEKIDEIQKHTGQAKQNAKRQADRLWKELTAALKKIHAYPE